MKKKLLFIISIFVILTTIGIINVNQKAEAQSSFGGFSNVSPFIRVGDAITLRDTIDYIGTYANPIPYIIVDNLSASSTFITSAEFDYILVNEVATSSTFYAGDGTAAAPSMSFASDTDTGLYNGGDIIYVTNAGSRKHTFTSTYFRVGSTDSSASALLATAATNIVPSMLPAFLDDNTGIGHNSADELSLIAGGIEGLRIDFNELEVQPLMTLATGPIEFEEDSGAITAMNMPVSSDSSDGDEMSMSMSIDSNPILKVKASATGTGGADDFQVVVDPSGTFGSATLPSLAFGDGNTGFYESADNTLNFTINGASKWKVTSIGDIVDSVDYQKPFINFAEFSSDTVPGFGPRTNDRNTGIGSSGLDQLSLIAGGVEGIRINEIGDVTSTTINGNLEISDTGTSTLIIDSDSATQGACLKLSDFDSADYTYCIVQDGTMTCSTDSCE